MSSPVIEAALAFREAGISVVPVALDGSKAPRGEWARYQKESADQQQIHAWFDSGHPALGAVCGAVSGNLEMLEFEGRAAGEKLPEKFAELMADHGRGELWERISTGYTERTPSGGLHYLYQVTDGAAAGNTKLAQRPSTAKELEEFKERAQAKIDALADDDPKKPLRQKNLDNMTRGDQVPKVLVETRGEGGFTVTAPTSGDAHPTYLPWQMLIGGPESIAKVTSEERDVLFAVARLLDQMPPPAPRRDPIPMARPAAPGSVAPGEDFNQRAGWEEILEPHGWTVFSQRGDVTHWTKPDKTRPGTSATTGYGGDYFYVFSTETGLPDNESLSKFATYTHLNHGGDYSAAARELRAQGYGSAPAPSRPATRMPTDGSMALDPDIAPEPAEDNEQEGSSALARDRYIHPRDGLKVATLARDTLALGPLAQGIDDRMWSYADGVWSPDPHVVRNRAVRLFGEHYRRAYGTNAEDVIKARVGKITCDPIGDVINFKDGLCYWREDRFAPHDPKVLSTVQLGARYDPSAECPEFDKFLAQVVPPDMIDFTWELIGYLMFSGNPLHKAVMLTGGGRNGKGTFLRVIKELLGGERNVTAVSLYDLASTRFAPASLFGKLANIAGDIDPKYMDSTAMFKAITGEDTIETEHKGRDRFNFTPWATPVFSANKIPGSADVTAGYLARWLVLPFPNSFVGKEDPDLTKRITTEAELTGIAAKAIPALRTLMARKRFETPESATEAMDEFARRVDQVRTWLDDCAEVNPALPFVNRTALYEAYKTWADRDRQRPVKAHEFYDRLEGAGAVVAKVRGQRGFHGVRVVDDAKGGWAVGAQPSYVPSAEGDE